VSKLGLLVLRQKGIPLLEKVKNRIATIESLSIKGVFGIKWEKEEAFFKIKDVYGHIKDTKILEDITNIQGNNMIAIVLIDSMPDPLNMQCPKCGHKGTGDRLDNMHINRIKDDFRSIYGNVIHSADTEKTAIDEMKKFGINKDLIDNFKNMEGCIIANIDNSSEFVKKMSETIDG